MLEEKHDKKSLLNISDSKSACSNLIESNKRKWFCFLEYVTIQSS